MFGKNWINIKASPVYDRTYSIYAFLEISTSRWRLVFGVRSVSERENVVAVCFFFLLDTDGIEFVKIVVKPLFNVSLEIISLPLL